ncbi:unnamed protein product, partial [Mesorhabditis spiculigera]
MLNGIYGYLFGAAEATDNCENEAPCVSKELVEDDWQLVGAEMLSSGRSSPVLVPRAEIQDIDELSLTSERSALTASEAFAKRAAEARQAREVAIQRLRLAEALFAETPASNDQSGGKAVKGRAAPSAGCKRISADPGSDLKGKQRSKKAGKLNSGRNNDRKCNNIN